MARASGKGLDWILIGEHYENREGVKMDKQTAFHYYQKAILEGDFTRNGLLEVGRCYEEGIGVDANPEKAFQTFKKAADNGCSRSKIKIAKYLEQGFGVAKDENKALEIYDELKEQGGDFGKIAAKSKERIIEDRVDRYYAVVASVSLIIAILVS